MPTPPPRPAADPWRDAEGTPIPEQCRVEQATVDKKHGALPSRLHQQGQVTGRGTTLLYILFDHLCRTRHKWSYADRRIMPSAGVEVLVSRG